MQEYWNSDWYRAEQGLPPLPKPKSTDAGDNPAPESPPTLDYDPYDPVAVKRNDAEGIARDIARLDAAADAGDIQAIRTRSGLRERRAKLLGLDAPVKSEVVTIHDNLPLRQRTTAELERMLADMTVIQGECHHEPE